MGQRVVVTGMGIVSSTGRNIREFEMALRNGQSGIGFLKRKYIPPVTVPIGAEIDDISLELSLQAYTNEWNTLVARAVKCARRSPLAVRSSVLGAFEAWVMARCGPGQIPAEKFGIIISGSNLTQPLQYEAFSKFQQDPEYLSPSYALYFWDTDQLGTLSEIFGLQGEGFTVGGASASGNVAIIKGYQMINSGIADACLVAGPMTDLSPVEFQSFINLGAMGGKSFADEPTKACRPFDRDHEGFIYGQASGCLILESADSAQKRGAAVFAEIAGGAIVLDGNRLSNPDEKGETRAMESALQKAAVNPKDVDYINTHGTSTPLGDETELQSVKNVFPENYADVWINSTKSFTGHCLNSAGIVEAIATIIQMRGRFVHPNLNLDHPIDGGFRFSGKTAVNAVIKTAVSNSFGFGGINTSLVIKGANLG